MVFSLSLWERAGVRATARTERKPASAGFFYGLLPLLVGGGRVRATARTERKPTSAGFFMVFSLSLWERGGGGGARPQPALNIKIKPASAGFFMLAVCCLCPCKRRTAGQKNANQANCLRLINGPSIFFVERSSTSSITDDSSFSSNFAT